LQEAAAGVSELTSSEKMFILVKQAFADFSAIDCCSLDVSVRSDQVGPSLNKFLTIALWETPVSLFN
jgi:hypothetical protein